MNRFSILLIFTLFAYFFAGCESQFKAKGQTKERNIDCSSLAKNVELALISYAKDSVHPLILDSAKLSDATQNCFTINNRIQAHVYNFHIRRDSINGYRCFYHYFTLYDKFNTQTYFIGAGDDFHDTLRLHEWMDFMKKQGLKTEIMRLITLLYEKNEVERYEISDPKVLYIMGFPDSLVAIVAPRLTQFCLHIFTSNHYLRYPIRPRGDMAPHQKWSVPYKDYQLLLLQDKEKQEYYTTFKTIDSAGGHTTLDITISNYLQKKQLKLIR